jgi:hypothetical protein
MRAVSRPREASFSVCTRRSWAVCSSQNAVSAANQTALDFYGFHVALQRLGFGSG